MKEMTGTKSNRGPMVALRTSSQGATIDVTADRVGGAAKET